MLVRITLVLEVLSIIVGIHRTYGEKIKVDIYSSILCISMLVVLELVNYHSLDPIYTNLNILFILIYCILKFREKLSHSIVSCGFALVSVTIVQFLSGVLIAIIPITDNEWRNFIANIVSTIFIFWVFPFCKLNTIRISLLRKNWVIYISLFFIATVFFILLLQRKEYGGIDVESFIFAIPAITIILWIITLWDKSVTSEKRLQQEIDTMLTTQEDYTDLLNSVRINQHGLKSHLSTLIATHYTYKTYEQLINTKDDYYEMLKYENRYNELIRIENRVLGGFLYGKMLEIEDCGINVEYKVETEIKDFNMPNYYMIELLGILFDNAIEYCRTQEGGNIYWTIGQKAGNYRFMIRNTGEYVSYHEISEWFKLGKSTKGDNRGIGLYRAKKICDEWEAQIVCSCKEIDEKEWIIFEVFIKREDDII